MSHPHDLVDAGRVLAGLGLVNAFGHVSVRVARTQLLITPPVPLGSLATDSPFAPLELGSTALADGVAKESWIHLAIADSRPDVHAVCRAQPETATALTSAGVPLRPLHGQGSFVGPEVPVLDDPRLVRDRARGVDLAAALGTAPAILLRGNGAVTVGSTIGHAVARMWVLETTARMTATAAAAGAPTPLAPDEQEAWRRAEDELCRRIWDHLREVHARP